MDILNTCLLWFEVCPADHPGQSPVLSGSKLIFYQKGDEFLMAQVPMITVFEPLFKTVSHGSKTHAAHLVQCLF